MNNNKKPISIWIICLILLGYRVLLDLVYQYSVSPVYAYRGYINNASLESKFISWVLFIIGIVFFINILTYSHYRMSNIIVSILFLISFIPFTTVVAFGTTSIGYTVFNTVYWFILLLAQHLSQRVVLKDPVQLRVGKIKINDKFVLIAGFVSLFIVLFISAVYTRFRINFNLFNVYELRSEAQTYNFPTALSYLFAWTRAINPVLMAYALINKKKIPAVIFFAVQMLSFGVDGLKSTFFMPFIVIIVVFVLKNSNINRIKNIIIIGAVIFVAAGLFEHMIIRTNNISTLFIRRMLFSPNITGEYYYDFFLTNEPDFFRGSALKLFGLNSPYAEAGTSVGRIIGSKYIAEGLNANNGLFSDAVLNLGNIGAFIMPVVLVLILRLFDRCSKNLDSRLTVATSFYLATVIMGTTITTVLFTHGALILMILFLLMDRNNLEHSDSIKASAITET